MIQEVTILKSEIMDEVNRITGYTGEKSNNMDNISSSSDDSVILNSYMEESLSGISDIISRYGVLSSNDTSQFIFTFTLPANWNTGTLLSLTNGIKKYVENFICMKWFALSNKDDVKYYDDLTKSLSISIIKCLTERNKPQRT